jgi:poly(A) polymerase
MSGGRKPLRVRFSGPFAWAAAPAVKKLVAALGKDNVRFVGGAVRDSLLKRPIKEIDLATTLPPLEVMARLQKARIRAVPTGITHGTVTAVFKDRVVEVTTLRHDVKTFGRRAEVAFHADWREDANRRDFTINALFLSLDGIIHDYFGGIADLKRGKVRFIGDPKQRIGEDALRILRFFRFHAWYGTGSLDRIGYAACEANLHLLDILSAERVRDETLKLLASPNPVPAVMAMGRIGIFKRLFAAKAVDFGALKALVARETALGAPDALRRLAVLFPMGPGHLSALGRNLKLSNRELARLLNMKETRIHLPLAERDLRKAVYLVGRDALKDQLILNTKAGGAATLKRTLKKITALKLPVFPVGGDDLKARGVPPGPGMGDLLDLLEKRWVASDFRLTKRELLKTVS